MMAQDLAHEAFVRATGRLAHLRSPQFFDRYLRRTLMNVSKNLFRHNTVERAYLERERHQVPTQSATPDIALQESMRSAILRLPARQRAAVVLRYYEDRSEQSTAELLGCRPGTVKSLVSRALKTLRAELQDAELR